MPVYIGGKPKNVTINLYEALQHLHHTSKERVTWIDALCIDQTNHSERTHQLSTMRLIFEQAANTTIWLGPAIEQHFPLAVKWLKRLGSDESLHLDPEMGVHAEVEGKHILSPEIIAGCQALFDNPWWSRIWTVQEWILSRHAVFQYGHHLVDNLVVQKSYANWKLHETKAGCCYAYMMRHPEWQETKAYNSPDDAIFTPECLDNIPLPYILSSFRKSRKATDPRDRIYGMLGLARFQYENAVVADYAQSVEMAFTTSAIQMISNTGSLEVLSHVVPGVQPLMRLPSFVPDWTSSHDDVHTHFSWLKWLKDKNEYNACKSMAADLSTTAPSHIRLKGIRVDEVEMVSSPLGPELTPGSLDPLLSLMRRYNQCNLGGHQIPETVFWSTI